MLLGDKIKVDEMSGICSMRGDMRNEYKILVGKLEGRKLLGKPRRRWEDNTRMDLWEVGWEVWT
jgi:hypothetical protein